MMNVCVRAMIKMYTTIKLTKYFGFDNKLSSVAFSPLLAFRGIREGCKKILEKYRSA